MNIQTIENRNASSDIQTCFLLIEVMITYTLTGIYTFLYEKWKKNVNLLLFKHLLIVFFRLFYCLVVILPVFYIFTAVLRASESQLLKIIAIIADVNVALFYYITDRLYD